MSNIYFIIFIILGGASLPVFSQSVNYSLPEKFSIRSQDLNILGKAQGEYYVHFDDRRDHSIHIYRDNLGLRTKKFISLDRNERLEKFFLLNNEILMFYTERTKTHHVLRAKKYDLELKEDTIIYSLDSLEKGFGKSTPEYEFLLSEDKSKVLIYFKNYKFAAEDKFHYLVTNNNLKVLSTNSFKIPTASQRTILHDVLISNNGNLFLVIGEYKDLSQNHASRYVILTSGNDFERIDHLILEAKKKKYLNNTYFKIDNRNNNIVAAGFYSESTFGPTAAEGIFYQVFNLHDPEESYSRFESFEPEFIARLKGRKKIRENERLYSFVIDDIILRQDGGALIISESYYKTLRNSADLYDPYRYQNINDASLTYHYDELMVISIHPNGTIHWKSVMPKSQVSVGDLGRYASYTLINTGYYLNFIYNDDIDSRTNVIQYSVDINGEQKREMLLNSFKNDIYMMPQLGKQVAANEIIIPSLKRRELRLVKLSY